MKLTRFVKSITFTAVFTLPMSSLAGGVVADKNMVIKPDDHDKRHEEWIQESPRTMLKEAQVEVESSGYLKFPYILYVFKEICK